MLTNIACRRILIIDDNSKIHADFDKIFQGVESNEQLAAAEAAFFGEDFGLDAECANANSDNHGLECELSHAYTGVEGVEMVSAAMNEGAPFDIAFVDMRMPDNWDGLRTIEEVWRVDRRIQVVLCTAYSDLSAHDIVTRFGQTDQLLFLRKPFDKVEASRIVAALGEKRRLTDLAVSHREHLESLVEERTANLNIALKKSKAAVLAKAEFISVMSHELKTPLNSILGFSEILCRSAKSAGLSEMHVDAAETINRNGHQLLKLITKVLEFVEMDSGENAVTIEACRPCDIMENAVGEYRRICASKELKLEIEVKHVSETIQTDFRVVGKILHHLLDNAIKFTDAGGEIRVDVDSDRQGGIQFNVLDTGVGIAPDRLPRLFDAFDQIDGSHTRKVGGAGLGLSLCHRLANSLDAEILVVSNVGVGSTFTLQLPAESTDEMNIVE
jgi:signal transduction histidine kinase